MGAKIIAIDNFCRELFYIIDITKYLGKAVGIPAGVPSMKFSVHKGIYGALILDRNFPPKFTPRSKYYAINIIWFCEEINKRNILLFKIATVGQIGYLFNKDITRTTLEYLQNKLMGW